jgi:hypothetical protein
MGEILAENSRCSKIVDRCRSGYLSMIKDVSIASQLIGEIKDEWRSPPSADVSSPRRTVEVEQELQFHAALVTSVKSFEEAD